MATQIVIPAILRSLTGGADTVCARGATVADLLADLDAHFPGMRARICDDAGEIRRFVNVYVNGEDIRFLLGKRTPVTDSDEITIVSAIAGG